ncbi:MAG TPA: aldehyde dehydrogenase family protein [Streptosporangiaceae bacterium]
MTVSATDCAVRIGGAPADPISRTPIPVTEPATGRVIAELAGGGASDAEQATAAATAALPGWADCPATDRARALRRIAEDLRDPQTTATLATLITRETGKRLAESTAEVGLSAGFFDWFAAAAETRHAELWDRVPGIRHEVTQHPLGVVALITPWNFPVSIPARKIAAALAAGCTVLFKPSEVAPSPALLLAGIVDRHVPGGVLCSVAGAPEAITASWLGDHRVRGMSFTGSTRVGGLLAQQAAARFLPCVLELGGNAPFLVLDDADLPAAVEMLMIAKYRNNGQSCIAANHVWVPQDKLSEFAALYTAASEALALGDPLTPATSLGPLALPGDPGRIAALADDAAAQGATVVRTRQPVPAEGHFCAPVICLQPADEAAIVTGEIFGPAVSIRGYRQVDDVLEATRRLSLGLGGYVAGADTSRTAAVARQLDVGIVGVNTGTPNTPSVPFGGLKDSGLGWEGSQLGLDAFTIRRTIARAVG